MFLSLLGGVIAMVGWLRWRAVENDPATVTMRVVSLNDTECIIRVTLKNNRWRTVVINMNDLPWVLSSGRLSMAITYKHKVLEPALRPIPVIIDAPPVIPITIKSGMARSGDINIECCFSNLLTAVENSDLTVLWAYELPAYAFSVSNRVVGAIDLPSRHH
jgi:hypothetical protein